MHEIKTKKNENIRVTVVWNRCHPYQQRTSGNVERTW